MKQIKVLTTVIIILLNLAFYVNPGYANNRANEHSTYSELADFTCAAVTEIPCRECEALLALYASTDGPYWNCKSIIEK